jgi:hypothetical protein
MREKSEYKNKVKDLSLYVKREEKKGRKPTGLGYGKTCCHFSIK